MKRLLACLALAVVGFFAAAPEANASGGWTIQQGTVTQVTPGPVYSVTITGDNGNSITYRIDADFYQWFSTRVGKTVRVQNRTANDDPGPPYIFWLKTNQPLGSNDYAEEV